MPKTDIAIATDRELLDELDALIARRQFPNRSQAIEAALAQLARTRLARECVQLDPREEKALGEEGRGAELAACPDY